MLRAEKRVKRLIRTAYYLHKIVGWDRTHKIIVALLLIKEAKDAYKNS